MSNDPQEVLGMLSNLDGIDNNLGSQLQNLNSEIALSRAIYKEQSARIKLLYEKRKGNTFKNIHTIFPALIAKLCRKYDLEHLVHVSALGVNEAKDSNYAISKLEGEKKILDKLLE